LTLENASRRTSDAEPNGECSRRTLSGGLLGEGDTDGMTWRSMEVCAVAVVCAVLVAGLHAQQPTGPATDRPMFRSEISLVEVSAVVTGDADAPVTDLTREDFEIFENGQRRPVVSARFLSAAATPPSQPLPASLTGARLDEVVTNRALADAPAFVLLLDDLNISAYDTHRAIRAGLGVLGAVPANALVSVINSSGEGGSLVTLGRSNQGHADRVRAFRGQYLNPNAGSAGASAVDTPCSGGADSPDCMDPTRAARRARALESIGQLFSRTGSRRKVLFWVVTDMGVSPLDPEGNREAQFAGLNRLLGGDVTVYAIDPRENFAPTQGTPVYNDRRTGGRLRVGTSDTVFQGPGGSTMALNTDDMVGVPLSQLTRETGGRWIQNANNVEKLLADVVTQNASSYVLAYESAASQVEGRHSLEVKVKRRGTKVSARRALIVPPGRPTPPPASTDIATARLREVIQGGVPFGTLALRVHVAPQFAAAGGPARALVTVRVDDDTATDAETIDLLVLAADDTGKVGSVERFAMRRPSGAVPWEGSVTLSLERGPYQLRIAASTPDGTRTGLLLHPIDMRPPSGDLLLGVPTLLSEDDQGIRPTLGRVFPIGHPLAFQVEVAGDAVRAGTATVQARLVDAAGAEVGSHTAATESAGSVSHLRATGLLATTSLAPGSYTLVIDARSAPGGRAVTHAIPVRLDTPAPGSVETSAASRPPEPRTITAVSVAHGPLTRHPQHGPHVIRTEGEWKAFWLTLPTRQAAPDIDFSRVTLLAIVSDDTGAAPGEPRVTHVQTEPGGVVVQWVTAPGSAPPADNLAPARPFVVVGLQGHQGRVRFERVN
jgi:VWFA-related protein